MKEYRASNGEKRIWYEVDEIEAITASELMASGLMPRAQDDDLIVDIESLVQRHLRLRLDQYAELDADILGVTVFQRGKRPKISISRDLTGSALDEENSTPGLVGRWRATVAHEAAHVLLHGSLFEFDEAQHHLFPASQTEPARALLRCLKNDVGYQARPSDWREVQANMGMAALLMPKPVFAEAGRQATTAIGCGDASIRSESREHLLVVEHLARRFSVSKQAARIRLSAFGIVHEEDAPKAF